MTRVFFIAVFVACAHCYLHAHKDSLNILPDTTNRLLSRSHIMQLKDGALILRLKTNDKSIEQYRKSGRNDVAEKIIADNRKRNLDIANAFRAEFSFCKVYFMFTRDTRKFLAGDTKVFLNDTLSADTTIQLKEKFSLFAEYGTVMANLRADEYHYSGVKKTKESSQPMSSSALFASDLNLNQLTEPFPFYAVVYLDNFKKAAARWSNSLEKYYTLTKLGGSNFKK